MNKKQIGILAFVFSLVLFALSMVMFFNDAGSSPANKTYGGDAYTGIQNAAAATARNVAWLNEAVCFGFGSVLLAAAFAFLLVSLHFWSARTEAENEPNVVDLVADGVLGNDDGDGSDDEEDGAWLCPRCEGDVVYSAEGDVWHCPECNKIFKVVGQGWTRHLKEV